MGKLKVIISGGGTGGHIFPAIAIARSIAKQRNDVDFLFVGAKNRMEMSKVPESGYKIKVYGLVDFKENGVSRIYYFLLNCFIVCYKPILF